MRNNFILSVLATAVLFSLTACKKGFGPTQKGDVCMTLQTEDKSLTDSVIGILDKRLAIADAEDYDLSKTEQSDILVRLRAPKNLPRIRRMLASRGDLGFWETFPSSEITPLLIRLGDVYQQNHSDKCLASMLAMSSLDVTDVVGYALRQDMASVDSIIRSEEAKAILPPKLRLLWSAKPSRMGENSDYYDLHAVRLTTFTGEAPVGGRLITNVQAEETEYYCPVISMQMNAEGARLWETMTQQNIGRCIAIVFDGEVLSAPRVQGVISGGSSQISGNFTMDEVNELAHLISIGQLPTPTRIVSESVAE